MPINSNNTEPYLYPTAETSSIDAAAQNIFNIQEPTYITGPNGSYIANLKNPASNQQIIDLFNVAQNKHGFTTRAGFLNTDEDNFIDAYRKRFGDVTDIPTMIKFAQNARVQAPRAYARIQSLLTQYGRRDLLDTIEGRVQSASKYANGGKLKLKPLILK